MVGDPMIAPCGIKIEIGQKWQEVDPRFTRIATVIDTGEVDVIVRTKYKRVAVVRLQVGNRRTWAQLSRFHGKRGGYKLFAEEAS